MNSFRQFQPANPAAATIPEITLEQFQELLAAKKTLRNTADDIGANLMIGDPSFRDAVMQLAMLEKGMAMADETINYFMPLMEKKYGFVVPEGDRPVAGTRVYSAKNDESYTPPSCRR